MLRVINEVRPTWVIGENVAGITTMVESCEITEMGSQATLFETSGGIHRYTAEFAFTIERICSDLESKGYSVQPMLIPACAVGAPHRRDRVFFIAHNNFASDSIHKGSMRESSTNATKEGKERISERNEVQWTDEPVDARSQSKPLVADTESEQSNRYGFNESEVGQQEQRQSRGSCCKDDIADSKCKGLEGQNESRCGEGREWLQIWRNFARCNIENNREVIYSDTDSYGLQGFLCSEQASDKEWLRGKEGFIKMFTDSIRMLHPSQRWRTFPAVSPIHRGNDGIPFDVDSLTISFSKWRTETIKAYGNAIVPQVMYRIFEAIEAVENNTL